jgi:hypothetical protein
MANDFCPACGRPRRAGISFCTSCNYYLGQASLQPPAAARAPVTTELFLVLLIAAAVMVALGVLLTSPAS